MPGKGDCIVITVISGQIDIQENRATKDMGWGKKRHPLHLCIDARMKMRGFREAR
jgi:hypothetical protein